MRHAAKVDANQTEIVNALRDAGYSVQSLAGVGQGCPDILVGGCHRRSGIKMLWIMEIKTPKGTLTPDQIEWHTFWRGPVDVVQTVDDAYKLVGIL